MVEYLDYVVRLCGLILWLDCLVASLMMMSFCFHASRTRTRSTVY